MKTKRLLSLILTIALILTLVTTLLTPGMGVYAKSEPLANISGPEVIGPGYFAEYIFSIEGIPALFIEEVTAIDLIFKAESESFKFSANDLVPIGGWSIPSGAGSLGVSWVDGVNSREWTVTLTLNSKPPVPSGDFDFLKLVLEVDDSISYVSSKVDLIKLEAATPAGIFEIKVGEGTVSAFSKYDVNRDGFVDLADVAAVAYFFWYEKDPNNLTEWTTLIEFESVPPGGTSRYVSPERCDVTPDDGVTMGDGTVNILDMLEVMLNYT